MAPNPRACTQPQTASDGDTHVIDTLAFRVSRIGVLAEFLAKSAQRTISKQAWQLQRWRDTNSLATAAHSVGCAAQG